VPRQLSADDAEEKQNKKQNLRTAAKSAVELFKQWWGLRKQRQKEIDASIARHADQELLYD